MDREEILDRYEAPLRRGALPTPPAVFARGTNPRCGDTLTMYALVQDGVLQRVGFDGAGCTVSQVAADVVAEMAEGARVAAVEQMHVRAVAARLGGTTRLDCAALGLHTLQQALSAVSATVRAHVSIVGRVQGVGFRYSTAEEAERRRLAGWVRNVESGGVEAVFQGSREAVEDMVRWCHRGPSGSFVRDVGVIWDEPLESLDRFEVRRTLHG